MRISFACAKTCPAMSSAATTLAVFIPFSLESFRGSSLRLGPASYGNRGIDFVAVALQLHRRRLAGGERGDEIQHRGRIGHRLAFHLGEHVARLDAGLVRR